MNASYYQSEGPNAVNTGSSYQPHSSKPVGGYGSANTNGYQNQPMPSATNEVTGHGGIPNKQGQSTGAEGKGPDFICRILDKLEKKFGGERFNNPDNNAKNQAMNQKTSERIRSIGPIVMKKLPQVLSMIVSKVR